MRNIPHRPTALFFWATVPTAAAMLVAGLNRHSSSVIAAPEQTIQQTAIAISTAPEPSTTTPEKQIPAKPPAFYPVRVTDAKSLSALQAKLGEQGMGTVLKLNRLDRKHVRNGTTLLVTEAPADAMALSPLPRELPTAQSLPKLILVSREAQVFGAYESGKLVYWGPTSTGKRSTQTPAGLYHTNWKKKETRSSVNHDWILPWAFNLDNIQGIAFHQYDLPGYPASHGCVRLLSQDAQWIFGWADTWVLSKDNSIAAYGTPVIIFGDYAHGKEAPWKSLAIDPSAGSVARDAAEKALSKYLPIVEARARARESLLLLASTR